MIRSLLVLATMVAATAPAFAQTASSPASTPAAGEAPPAAAGSPPGNVADAPDQQTSHAALTARRAIEHDGYKDVQDVAKGNDGLWHARAMRGDTQVQVTVDRTGQVSAR
jgi:hypothetical protein